MAEEENGKRKDAGDGLKKTFLEHSFVGRLGVSETGGSASFTATHALPLSTVELAFQCAEQGANIYALVRNGRVRQVTLKGVLANGRECPSLQKGGASRRKWR